MTSKNEQIVEREIVAFAHRLKDQNISTEQALAALTSGAAYSLGATLKANKVDSEIAGDIRDSMLKDASNQFKMGYDRGAMGGVIV